MNMSKFSVEIKWTLIFVAASLLWILAERLAGLHDVNIESQATYTNFFAVIAIGIYVFALLDKKKAFYSGVMSYKQGFITGLWITLGVTLFTPITQAITHFVITPDYLKNLAAFTVQKNLMTKEMADAYFSFGSYLIQSLIFAPVVGVVTSAIVAIFTKSKAPQS